MPAGVGKGDHAHESELPVIAAGNPSRPCISFMLQVRRQAGQALILPAAAGGSFFNNSQSLQALVWHMPVPNGPENYFSALQNNA